MDRAPIAAPAPMAVRRLMALAGRLAVVILTNIAIAAPPQFVYDQIMSVELEEAVSLIAAAIGEPARARILFCLIDGRARTILAGRRRGQAAPPDTPNRLRSARTCYDHIAGTLGVLLHDRFQNLEWLGRGDRYLCDLTNKGIWAFEGLGIDVEETRALRRQFAFPCLDWSERRSHIGRTGSRRIKCSSSGIRRGCFTGDEDRRGLLGASQVRVLKPTVPVYSRRHSPALFQSPPNILRQCLLYLIRQTSLLSG